MTKQIIFRDCYKIVQPSEEDKAVWSDALGDPKTKKGLWVSMDASHSAMGNRNNRFYLPSKMEAGANSFMGRKGKTAPILKHHGGGIFGGDQDPVGKVRGVEYVSTIPENLIDSDEVDLMTDTTIPLKKQVRAAKRFLQNDFVNNDEWEGLGFIRLDAEILAPEAIEQVKDGRFDSVSVSFGTDHAFCSVCYSDWVEGDRCEHTPGEVYEDEETGAKERMLLIPGNMKFRECSLVTFDADPHTVIAIKGMSDSEDDAELFLDNVMYDMHDMSWEVRDSEGGAPMKKDVKKTPVESLEDSKSGSELNADEVYGEITKEFEAMVKDGLLTEEEMKDTVLSDEQRASLADSVFCGPDKTFPVPDCAHITATKRYLDRQEEAAEKTDVLAKLADKEKALGYKEPEAPAADSDDDSNNQGFVSGSLDYDTMEEDSLRGMFHDIEAAMVKRGLTVKRECSECASHEQTAKDAVQDKEDALKDLERAKSTVDVLRDELRSEFANYKMLVDNSVEQAQDLREARTRYAAVAAVLSKKSKDLGDATKKLSDAEDFDKEYNNFTDSVDLNEIFVKMNDGMVNDDPDGQVDDPTLNNDADNDQKPEGLTSTEQAIVDRCKEHIEDGDYRQARMLFDRMKTKGILSDSVKWETILPADEEADK